VDQLHAGPDIPAMAEFVGGYEVSNKTINAGLADAEMKERFAELGGTVFRSHRSTSATVWPRRPESGGRWSSSPTSRSPDGKSNVGKPVGLFESP
jgi:hypothetical protein